MNSIRFLRPLTAAQLYSISGSLTDDGAVPDFPGPENLKGSLALYGSFFAYRFSMIVFAACTLLFVFGISRLFLSDRWSLFAVLVTATTPFFVHETYFTWPKLEAPGFVLVACYLVLRARFLFGGLALDLGFMCHPAALFIRSRISRCDYSCSQIRRGCPISQTYFLLGESDRMAVRWPGILDVFVESR